MEEEMSLADFLTLVVMVVIITFITFIFAKPDNKKSMLNTIGLDLSGSAYETLKKKEYSKKCLLALMNASMRISQEVHGEKQFLEFLIDILGNAMYSTHLVYLHVPLHYVQHAWSVANNRYDKVVENKEVTSLLDIDFNDEKARKRYIKLLWKKYQYPWPSDWLKAESTF